MAAGSLQSPFSWTCTPCSPGAASWTSMSTTTPDAVGVMRAVPEVLPPLRGSSAAVATEAACAGAPAGAPALAAAVSLEDGTDEEAVAQAPARTRSSNPKRMRSPPRKTRKTSTLALLVDPAQATDASQLSERG